MHCLLSSVAGYFSIVTKDALLGLISKYISFSEKIHLFGFKTKLEWQNGEHLKLELATSSSHNTKVGDKFTKKERVLVWSYIGISKS